MGKTRLRRAGLDEGAKNFSIQLPPPNVTGTLHMGHAFNQTIMDGLTRYHRMLGENTLWLPGTDHAGIATQIVVERQLDAQGRVAPRSRPRRIRRTRVGVEGAVRLDHHAVRCAGWAPRSTGRANISRWTTRCRPPCCEVFVTLYKQGLIYRGKRLVNWDPVLRHGGVRPRSGQRGGRRLRSGTSTIRCRTAAGHLTVATTRPETMLGDVAVMVHPEDERYAHLIGKTVKLPLTQSRDPDHRRRLRGSRIRHRRGEGHARARFQRLPGRPAPPAAA